MARPLRGKAEGKYEYHYLDTLYSALNSVFSGDLGKTHQELQENVEKAPNSGDYYFFLGVIYLLKGDKISALEFLKKGVEHKGFFTFFSNEWLKAVYLYDGDINNFLKTLHSQGSTDL